MTQVTVSSKYQVVIPEEARKSLNIHKGQKMLVVVRKGLIELIPDTDITEMKGFLKGLPIGSLREEEDRY